MTASTAPAPSIRFTAYDDVREVLRAKPMRQALYDDGALVMADCLLDLHGDQHRDRRRLENRLFRRETFHDYERSLLPRAISGAIEPAALAGRGDLVRIGYRTVMHLTALVAGIDVPPGSDDELEPIVKALSRGATAVHATGDRAALHAEVSAAMAAFEERFVRPSADRRRTLLDAATRGAIADDEVPRDVLTTLLRNVDALDLPHDVIVREVAFYLQAGGHSTANALTHTLDEIWSSADPTLASRATDDIELVQRCVHETLRLHPASPVAWRRALEDVTMRDGRRIDAGTLVVLDLEAANRDPAVWGAGASRFDPERSIPEHLTPWGLSFGAGAHACIGMELDGGTVAGDGERLYGTVALLASALLRVGARRDPYDPPQIDATSERLNFARYPVLFARANAR